MTTAPDTDIPQAEIWLKEVVLLAHQGNRTAAMERLKALFPVLFPTAKPSDIRGPSRNKQSDPTTLAVVELDLGAEGNRIAGALERSLGVVYVWQLQKYRDADLLDIPNFGPTSLEKLKAALRKALNGKAVGG